MKNVLTITREEIVVNYTTEMWNFLSVSLNELEPNDFAREVRNFGTDLFNLNSTDLPLVRRTLQRMFSEGHTMMMLAPEDFDTLEQWYQADKHYQVVVFNKQGEPIGSFNEEVVRW
jgi:hypothetical protein